ncbi:hypothetical protein AB0I55_20895 [Actinocatenispora sera]|uniref:hypothetical protein n=1 Tax=Actinocatenispora sera TaxID=390989 RepID=UPI0033F5A7DA
MSPDDLLAEARLVSDDRTVLLAYGARVCATLIRVALERALDEYWAGQDRTIADGKMHTQLLVLRAYRPDLARDTSEAWHSLCRMAHHHFYELPPTSAELSGWRARVGTLLARLKDPPTAMGNSSGTFVGLPRQVEPSDRSTLPCGQDRTQRAKQDMPVREQSDDRQSIG